MSEQKMHNREVPLEKFDVPFSESACDNPRAVREKIVTVLRFLDSKMRPEIEAFEEGFSREYDRTKRTLTQEDVERSLYTQELIKDFLGEKMTNLNGYIVTMLHSPELTQKDIDHIQLVAEYRLDALTDSLKKLASRAQGVLKSIQ